MGSLVPAEAGIAEELSTQWDMRWINNGTVGLAMGNRVSDFHGEPSERSPRFRRCLQGEDRRDWRGGIAE